MTRLALYHQYYRANPGPKVPSADYTGSLREFDPGSLRPGLKSGSFDDRRFEILEWTRRNLIYHDLMLERYLKMQAEAKAKAEAEAQKKNKAKALEQRARDTLSARWQVPPYKIWEKLYTWEGLLDYRKFSCNNTPCFVSFRWSFDSSPNDCDWIKDALPLGETAPQTRWNMSRGCTTLQHVIGYRA